MKSLFPALFLVSFSLCPAVHAQEDTRLAEATRLYSLRAESPRLEQAISILTELEATPCADLVRYDALILHSRSLFFQAMNTRAERAKENLYERAMNKADQARKLIDEYADGHYHYGAAMIRWAAARGPVASLGRKREFLATVDAAMERETRDGQPGETIAGYGPDVGIGFLYFKLPAFAGGSLDRALRHLARGYVHAPEMALNAALYAEALWSGTAADRDLARRILDQLLASDPETLHPARIPETRIEIDYARQLRKEMGN